jgi:hypothetical protein
VAVSADNRAHYRVRISGEIRRVLLLVAVILSVITVPVAGGSLSALGRVQMRYLPAIFGAVAIQTLILAVFPDGSPVLHRVLHIASYVLAAVFVIANRRLAGMRVLGLGATLNLIVILANNGVMPASASARRTAGMLTSSTQFLNSAVLPHPRLLFLADVLAVPHAVPFANVYSIGDVCIAIGVAIAIHGLAGSRLVPRPARAAIMTESRTHPAPTLHSHARGADHDRSSHNRMGRSSRRVRRARIRNRRRSHHVKA